MNKSINMRLIICFFLGSTSFLWANAAEETQLLPEVAELLTLKPIDESTMDQNAYVALMGIDAPLDKDPIEVGKKIILSNLNKLKSAYEERDSELGNNLNAFEGYYPKEKPFNINMEVDGEKYLFPCRYYYPTNCLDQVLADRKTIELLIVRNNGLLQRYAKIIKMPDFDYYYSAAMSPMPAYSSFMSLFDIRLSEAVFAINEGNIQQGLTILQENMDFAKRMLSGRSSIVDIMIALNQLSKGYHVIAELLDSDILSNELNNPQLIALLQPLSAKEQQSLRGGFKSELAMILAGTYYYHDELIKADTKNKAVDLNASMNFIYEENALFFNILERTLPESGKYYREYLVNNKIENQARLLKAKNIKKYAKINIITNPAIVINFDWIVKGQESALYRLYDVANYLALVNAKLKIKQADIKAEDVAKFLIKMGNDAKNPYSNKPFIWDANAQMLSSDWISTRGKTEERDGLRATVEIKFKTE